MSHLEQFSTGAKAIVVFPGLLSTKSDLLKIFQNNFPQLALYQFEYAVTSSPDYISFVNDLSRQLLEVKAQQIALIGYSLGARLAIASSINNLNKYAGYFLEGFHPGLNTPEEREERLKKDQKLAQQLRDGRVQEFLSTWYANPIYALSLEQSNSLINQKLRLDFSQIAEILEITSFGYMPNYRQFLKQIESPFALIVGEKDQKFCTLAQEVEALLPQPTVKKIHGAGHATHLQQPDAYADCLRDFLKKINFLS